MKEFFEFIEFLFVDILFLPFDVIRLDIANWFLQNAINFSFMLVISAALIYWTLELVKYDKNEGKKLKLQLTPFFSSKPISFLNVFPSKLIFSILP